MDYEVIRRAPLFAALDPEDGRVLSAAMTSHSLERGETLFSEGEQGHELFVIKQGKIKLGRTNSDGRENLLGVMGPGEMFGELSMFDPGPRTSTATAVTRATVIALSNEELLRFLAPRPEVALQMLGGLARRLRKTNDNLADMVFTDVPGRVAKAILDMAERFGSRTENGLHVQHDLTQEELAQLVGASRETVNKALADFAARGWIHLEPRGGVLVLQVERLRRRSR